MEVEQPGAASPGTQTETVTVERAAADAGDVGKFLAASRERRSGKAPANVERPKAEPKAAGAVVTGRDGQPAKGPADKDREADERLTTRIREAVDTSTSELRKKNEALEEQIAGLRRGPAERTPAADGGRKPAAEAEKRGALTSADIKRYQAQPGAPKLDDKDPASGAFLYETTHEHAIALADFIREARDSERAEASRGQATRVERVQREAARVTSFAGRVETFKQANPTLLVPNDKGEKVRLPLSQEVGDLHGFAQLHKNNETRQAQGLAALPATVDHAIAEELYDSEIPGHVAVYLSTHPDELAQLRRSETPAALTRAFGRLEERVIKADPKAATVVSGGAAAHKADEQPGAGAISKQPTADSRRKAEEAVDRSVSSAKPLEANLGRPGAGGDSDPESRAVKTDDFGMFQEIQRQRRVDKLQGARAR